MRLFTLLCLLSFAAPVFATETPPVKNYSFVNQNGKAFQLYDFKGKYLFVSFVYSRCPMPKMCPLTMTLSKQVLKKWKEAKEPAPLHVLAVTLDPEHDTPKVLKQYGESRNVDFKYFTLATGNPQVLSDFASEFNVLGFPSDGMISHNVKSILVGPNMVPIKEYKENEWSSDQVIKDLKAAASKKS